MSCLLDIYNVSMPVFLAIPIWLQCMTEMGHTYKITDFIS